MEKGPVARLGSLKAFVFLAFTLCAVPGAVQAKTCQPADAAAAEAFVERLHEGARNILLTAADPVRDMAALIAKNVEIDKVAQAAMGPAWNGASARFARS